ncbi:MAG: N-acetylmuramoyl-L-alanine amidase family protein, partial [Actinomycetota bacterium]
PILRETQMPAVVVEPCFLTNPKEAALLADPAFLDLLASAMLGAITSYFAEAPAGVGAGRKSL